MVAGGPVPSLYAFDPAAKAWQKLQVSLPHGMAYMGSSTVENIIYLLGGRNENEEGLASRDVLKFDPDKMEITRLSSMGERRNYVSSAYLQGFIYAIGGDNHIMSLSSVEKFDIARNQWTKITSMKSARSDAAAAALDGKIFVVGGFEQGIGRSNTAIVYCPVADTWTSIPRMNKERL